MAGLRRSTRKNLGEGGTIEQLRKVGDALEISRPKRAAVDITDGEPVNPMVPVPKRPHNGKQVSFNCCQQFQ